MKFEIPTIDNSSHELFIDKDSTLIFVGANGSGKTRLGYYLEELLFSLTNQGVEQKHLELKNLKQELERVESSVNSLNIQILELRGSSDEKIVEQALKYQTAVVMVDDNTFCSHLEIASMVFSGRINHVTFNSNRINSYPARSLNDISGGQILIGNVYLEVDLLKVSSADIQSISIAREYRINKLDVLLHSKVTRRSQLLEGIQLLENQIAYATTPDFNYCERISAHRSLVVDENLSPRNLDQAVNTLHYGDVNQAQNTNSKWGGKPFGTILSDFGKLMIAFLSEEADVSVRFRQANNSDTNRSTPSTNFDKALAIWNKLLPHRTLKLDGLSLKVKAPEHSEYAISEMSEGERSLFYILGKCLFAKDESLIIIDEPDIHIHKAILSSFFDSIEKARTDCAFIYITHDLEFAASRRRSTVYALYSYEHVNKWELQEIQHNKIPEVTYSKICGSRKNILFVEGKAQSEHSLDKKEQSLDKIYKDVYSNLEVVLVGSCEEVRSYTKSMNSNSNYHRVQCFGLVDRDGLDEEKINSLSADSIYVLPVAIVENIFLLPDIAQHIFRITGEEASFDESDFVSYVIDWIESDDNWKSKTVKDTIRNTYMQAIGKLPSRINDLSASCTQSIQNIDPKVFVDEFELVYANALSEANKQNHPSPLLKICRGKHLLSKFSRKLGLDNQKSLELKILNNIDRDEDFLTAVRKVLPSIPG